jgi:hypothetical protein
MMPSGQLENRMNRPRLASIPLIFLFFAVTALAADQTWDSEFGNTLYNTPKGWSTTQKSGTLMLIPPDLAPGDQAAIVITPGGELKAGFKDALDEFRARLRGSEKAKESKVESLTADEGYPVLDVAEQIEDGTGAVKQFRYFFASHPGSRIEFVFLVANSRESFDRYTKVFSEFVKTVAYKNVRPGARATTAPTVQEAK